MRLPDGFRMSAGTAGIKPSGRSDLGLLLGDAPLAWSLASTTNRVVAPCVARNRARHASGQGMRALIINSGNANCAMGDAGVWDNEEMAALAGTALEGVSVREVLTASTGVIGRRLPVDKIRDALPALVEGLSADSAGFARAILTTDHVVKEAEGTLAGGARIVGVAKGSGMIHPQMATMLAFVVTDADVGQQRLRELWPQVVDRTFNQVTVDGDTSTNDMALVMASGRFAVDDATFVAGLERICASLAQQIARDGEGATKLITVEVAGARSEADARAAARTVAGSALVKAAIHGNDPNWGRILAAVGRSGAIADLGNLEIRLQDHLVYDGEAIGFDAAAVSASLDRPDVLVRIDLAAGQARGTAWGCDLSADYVKINADYTT